MILFSLIPLPLYTPLFYNVLLLLVFSIIIKLLSQKNTIYLSKEKEYASAILLLMIVTYIGLRPVSGYFFGDMGRYNKLFNLYAQGVDLDPNLKDYFWHLFVQFCSTIMTATSFFVLCAFLYIFPLYKACKKWFKGKSYIPFLMFIASFSFWAYGTNGIRNGIASSFFIYALSYDKNKSIKYAIFLISYLAHGSMFIPITAYVLTVFYKNPKHYLLAWTLAIPLSLAFGGFWEVFFTNLGFGGDRLDYLTDDSFAHEFSRIGFRWDFLLYSASAVFAGYYFIIKKQFEDKLYQQLFNVYLTTNAFWILIIRASFSNRFAYLSWFLMAAIIFYPFFKRRFFVDQQKRLATIILLYFGFTYYMTF